MSVPQMLLSLVSKTKLGTSRTFLDSLKQIKGRAGIGDVTAALRELTRQGKIAALTISMSGQPRHIYYSIDAQEIVEKKIAHVEQLSLELVGEDVVATTGRLVREISVNARVDPNVVLLILKRMVIEHRLRLISFIKSNGNPKVAFFLPESEKLIQESKNGIMETLEKVKWCFTRELTKLFQQIPHEVVTLVLKHLLSTGALNRLLVRIDGDTGRAVYLYMIPGYRQKAESWLIMHFDAKSQTLSGYRQLLAFREGELSLATYSKVVGLSVQIVEKARELLANAYKKKIVKGRDWKTVSLTCLFLASKVCGTPLSAHELVERTQGKSTPIYIKSILRTSKVLRRVLEVPIETLSLFSAHEQWIDKITNLLGLTEMQKKDVRDKAVSFLGKLPGSERAGRNPVTVAAAIIYIAARTLRVPLTQLEVASAAGITEVTVRNNYKHISNYLDVSL